MLDAAVPALHRDHLRVGGGHYAYTHSAAIAELLGDKLVPLRCSNR